MSIMTFHCDKCGQAMRVGADKAGRKAKCTKCAEILTIPQGDAAEKAEVVAGPPKREADRGRGRYADDDDRPPPRSRRDDNDEDDRPRRSRRDDDDDDRDSDRYSRREKEKKTNWPKVAVGALVQQIGAIALFASVLLMGLCLIVSIMADLFGSLRFSENMRFVAGIVSLVGALSLIPILVGQCFFLNLSSKHGWGLALTCVILIGGAVGFAVLGILLSFVTPFGALLVIMSFPLFPAHMITTAILLWRIGHYRDRDLANRGKMTLIMTCVSLGYGLLFGIIVVAIRAAGGGGQGVVITILLLGVIGYGIMLATYLSFMMASILLRRAVA